MRSNQSQIDQLLEVTVIYSDNGAQFMEDWMVVLGAIILGIIIIFD
jgi:hypothetical protein